MKMHSAQPVAKIRRGGALVEILLSVAIIGTLFTLLIKDVDIGGVFNRLWSTGDETAVRAIGESLSNYRWDNNGNLPPDAGITSSLRYVCKESTSQGDCSTNNGVYLMSIIPDYLQAVPTHDDFRSNTELYSGYLVQFPYGNGERLRVVSSGTLIEFTY